ncbi:Heat shock protein 90 [Durusdinium trenchii]|uniref:Heat shock protein 90 n=1 Tax=Durusdinium trenchii TaxID=1381693 RepID=A0ABP0I217_9DINO
MPVTSFAGSERPPLGKAKYPDTSNDLTQVTPDSQPFKYGEPRSATMGTCPRDVITNAPDLNGFPKGRISPGPMRYNIANCPPATRLQHAPGCDQVPPKWSIGHKTKILELESQTGQKVGPGTYPLPDACGKQYESDKKSNPTWSCCKKDRFPKKAREHDTGRLWDGEGKRKAQFNRRGAEKKRQKRWWWGGLSPETALQGQGPSHEDLCCVASIGYSYRSPEKETNRW